MCLKIAGSVANKVEYRIQYQYWNFPLSLQTGYQLFKANDVVS